jgi:hypothetical protein
VAVRRGLWGFTSPFASSLTSILGFALDLYLSLFLCLGFSELLL